MTFALALAFIINTLALGFLYTKESKSSVVDTIVPKNNTIVPAAPNQQPTPDAPAAPNTKK
jgi:preprotein translocase subunit SecG